MTPSGDMPDEAAQQERFSLANIVPQTPELNRGIWERIETTAREMAQRDGEIYIVTGPAYHGQDLQSLQGRVLVPTSTWKAIYDPRAGAAGAYVCKNFKTPTCVVLPVSAITEVVGVDPFPALPANLKETAMALPLPQSRHRGHVPPASQGWLELLLNFLGVR